MYGNKQENGTPKWNKYQLVREIERANQTFKTSSETT